MKLSDFIQEFAENHKVQHTLCHAIIKSLSLSCGYASAALHERVYIDELTGIIVASLNNDIYLVNTGDVNE